MNTELGHFDLFLDQTGFACGRRHRPPPCYTCRPGRSATTRRSCRQVSQRTTAGRAQIRPANAAAAATVGGRIFLFFGHSRPTHTSLPPFLDPLNSFPWSLFTDFSPFEIYDENKFGRLLDRVFRPPQQPLDQGKGTAVFLASWAFR